MPIHITLVPNPFNDKFRAVVRRQGRISYEQFIGGIIEGTTLTSTDIVAVLTALGQRMVDFAADGKECDIGLLGSTRLGVRGTFDSAAPAEITSKDVDITLSLSLSPHIRKMLAQQVGKTQIVQTTRLPQDPLIKKVWGAADNVPLQLNKWAAGRLMEIRGHNLKFSRKRRDEGVFFLRRPKDPPVRATTYGDLTEHRIGLNVPDDLQGAGTLRLEVRRRIGPRDKEPAVGKHASVLREIK